MADTRITQLPALSASGLATNDVLPIADISASQTKKITAQDLATAGYALLPNNSIDIAKINQNSATKIDTVALADSGVTATKLAANSSIYNGGVAPTSNNFNGRGFFNTNTGELKIYNGGSFSSVTTSIGALSITSSGLADNAVTTVKIIDDAVTYGKLQNASTTDILLGRQTAGAGNFEEIPLTAAGRALLDDATAADQRITLGLGNIATAVGTFANGSIVSGVSTGTNTGDQTIVLTGDVTGTGTGGIAVTIPAGTITATKIANNTITNFQLASGTVNTSSIADAAITSAKIATDTITANNIAVGAIGQSELANNSVTYAKIQATSTSDVVLGRSSAGGGTVEEIPLTSAGRALLDDATTADQRTTLGLGTLATANGTWTNGSSFSGTSTGTNTGDQTIVLTGDITGTGTGSFATTISNNAVTVDKINANAVTTAKIANDSVTGDKIADNSSTIVNNAIPVGSGNFIGQQWLNSTTGIEYTWNGSSWQRQAAINTITFSSTAPITLTASYPDNFSTSISVAANSQPATYVWSGPASGTDASPTFRALLPTDLPSATNSSKGIVQPGTGLQVSSGVINHANSVASGAYTKVTIDSQGHVSAGTTLSATDIPSLNASIITAGSFGTAYISNDAITSAKLADYSVSKIGDALPTADHIGQFFFNPLDKNIYLWDGNVWQPVGVSLGEIVFAGTYNANLNKIASTTTVGAAAGLIAGSGLPLASSTFNSYYLVVASGGTGIAPAPTTALNPPDILLCDGIKWNEVDVSSTYASQTASNIGFTPAGTIASTNVQLAIEEVASEAANATNLTSGTIAVARGGTGFSSYTKGDLIVASGTTALAKLTAGTNGYVLRSNSATSTGLEWGADYIGTVTNVTSSTNALTVANGTTTPALTIRSATTAVDGIVQLTDSTNTTSSVLAASATAVKSAYDLANAALPLTGGLLTGNLSLDTNLGIIFEGTTADNFETTLLAAGPVADRTIYLPDSDGTLVISGNIANADIASGAAIIDTKLATISTADKVSISALNIDGATDIGSALADVDLFIVDDGGAGTNRKAAASRLPEYIFPKVSGDIAITASGVATIASGVIVNADINASAAITDGKLATISTANKVSIAALDIDGGTDIGAALTNADLFIVDYGGAGTNRKAAATRITDYAFGKVSGDITITASGVAAIASGVISNANINASAAIADTKLATISTAGKVSGTAITSGNISTSGSFATTNTMAVGQSSAAANTDFDLAGTYAQTVVAVSALNIDCSIGNYFTKTINGASTFTVSNIPASRAYSFTLELTHTSGAITWFSGVEWPGGTAPTLTTGKTHLFMFVTDDGGTRWRASSLINYTN